MTILAIGLLLIRVVTFIIIYLIARVLTDNMDIDNRVYWMFGAGYIVGRIWSMIGT